MKKIFFVLIVTIVLSLVEFNSFANEEALYEDFMRTAKSYDSMKFTDVMDDKEDSGIKEIIDKIYNAFFDEIKKPAKIVVLIIMICALSSILRAFVSKGPVADAGEYGVYCVCALLVISSFKTINDICVDCIDDLTDFMDIAVPTYVAVLASCGFGNLAISMQSLFMSISLLIAHLIKGIICPLLFCCGLVSVVGGVSKTVDLSGFIRLISKTVKYILGIILTVFAGVLAFSGFSSSATDSLAVQTAKFAVSNFVPVVGGCLSSALNGLKQSTVLLKNNMGYVGFLILVSLCIVPVVKIMISVFSLKLCATVVHMFSESKLAAMLDSVCEVLVTLGSLVVFVAVVFVLIIGVISAVG